MYPDFRTTLITSKTSQATSYEIAYAICSYVLLSVWIGLVNIQCTDAYDFTVHVWEKSLHFELVLFT